MQTSTENSPIRLEDIDKPLLPKKPNVFRRFWNTITKTPARRFATALVVGLLLSALVLGLMFALPELMIGLTMFLGSAAFWTALPTFALQVVAFSGVVTAAVTAATTFFWGIGELLGLAVSKYKANRAYRETDRVPDAPAQAEQGTNPNLVNPPNRATGNDKNKTSQQAVSSSSSDDEDNTDEDNTDEDDQSQDSNPPSSAESSDDDSDNEEVTKKVGSQESSKSSADTSSSSTASNADSDKAPAPSNDSEPSKTLSQDPDNGNPAMEHRISQFSILNPNQSPTAQTPQETDGNSPTQPVSPKQ